MAGEHSGRSPLTHKLVRWGPALGAVALAFATQAWRIGPALIASPSPWVLLAIGGLLGLAIVCAISAFVMRIASVGAFAALLAAFGLAIADLASPEPGGLGGQLTAPALALLLVSTDWLAWTLFQGHLRKIRINQIYRVTGTVTALLALVVTLGPGPLQLPALILGVTTSVATTLVILLDTMLFDRARPAYLFAAAFTVGAVTLVLHVVPAAAFPSMPPVQVGLAVALVGLALAFLLALRESLLAQSNARRRAFDAARKYRHVYYSVPVALVSIDSSGQVLRWNDMADDHFGQWMTKGRLNFLSRLIGDEGQKQLLRQASTAGRHTCELRLPGNDSGPRVYAVDALAVGNSIEVSFVDVSERTRLSDILEHMAHHDFLTDRLNRRGLERHIDALLQSGGESGQACVLYIDLDRFKSVNDVFGHAAGDAVVVQAMQRIASVLPEGAALGRLGGDEFLVALLAPSLDEATALAERVRRAISAEACVFEGMRLEVEASLGVVTATSSMTTRELIAQADDACAQSKRNGRAKVTSMRTTHESLHNYRAEMYYSTQLKSNLPIDRLRLHAQPIVPLRDDTSAMSFEVLLRTEDEHGRVHTAAQLLAAAERQGAMAVVDRFVLGRALEHLSANPQFNERLGYLAINLSGMSLNNEGFVADAVSMIKAHPGIASSICLEITESIALYDMRNTRRFVDQMRSIGVSVALDDFGAGYTSFAYLRELPATIVKIDGQFILDVARDPKQRGIVRAIQQLAGELGMRSVAEWVEDVETLRTLLDLEIDYAQGFVLSRAQPIRYWLDHSVDLSPLHKARRLQARSDPQRTRDGNRKDVARMTS